MKLLLVKTSSMGDVIHCLPAVSDMRRHRPDLTIDWVVEEGLADLPALHPAVNAVLPVATRRWRKAPFSGRTWGAFNAFRAAARGGGYDMALDEQGLLRSALLARRAHAPTHGYDRHSIREPLASLFYDHRYAVSRARHAIDRNRTLAGLALGYEPDGPVDYGLRVPAAEFDWLPQGPYLLAIHATSRADKLWDEANWIGLGRRAGEHGLTMVFPWGGAEEKARAKRLAAAIPSAVVAPKLTLAQATSLAASATVAVGVDTGLVHLAAAAGAPTVAIYLTSTPGLTGVMGSAPAVNLGGSGAVPSVDEVWAAASDAGAIVQ